MKVFLHHSLAALDSDLRLKRGAQGGVVFRTGPCLQVSLCFALLCFALLCFALLCFALLCFALLCFAREARWGGRVCASSLSSLRVCSQLACYWDWSARVGAEQGSYLHVCMLSVPVPGPVIGATCRHCWKWPRPLVHAVYCGTVAMNLNT